MANVSHIFCLSESASEEIQEFRSGKCSSALSKKFYLALFDGCLSQPNYTISRKQFIATLKEQGLAHSSATVTMRINLLKEIGAATEVTAYVRSVLTQTTTITSLKTITRHFNRPESDRKTVGRPVQQTIFTQTELLKHEATFLEMKEPLPARVESLFSILDSAMRLSGHDQRKNISCKYLFSNNDFITITANTTTAAHGQLSCLSDERAMRAINTIIFETIEDKHGRIDTMDTEKLQMVVEKERYFFFDIHDLCRRMGMSPNLSNKNQARLMVERLRDTSYTIDASNSEYFRSRFSWNADRDYYSYITEFKSKGDYEVDSASGKKVLRDRFYFIKIHEAILTNLLSIGRSFISHDELLSDRSGIAHRLNNWCKAVIGVRKRRGDPNFTYTIDEFHARVLPSAIKANFRRDFIALIKRQCELRVNGDGTAPLDSQATLWNGEGNTNVAWLYGYFIKIEWDEHKHVIHSRMRGLRRRSTQPPIMVTIWRDQEDLLVGDNSSHNQAIRRQTKNLFESSAHEEPGPLSLGYERG